MQRILVATHGGASADGAVHVAADLAARLGATLSAFCAVEPTPVADVGYGVPCMETPEAAEARRAALRTGVEIQLERCGVSAPVRCVHGPAKLEITAAARDVDAGLIVLGLGPHGFLDRAFGHETALQLAQSASVPVLAVAAGAVRVPRNVLIAVDFSPTCLWSTRMVAEWMRAGDVLHLVHVVPAVSEVEREADGQRVRELFASQLEALVADLSLHDGVDVRTTIADGEPAQVILHIADEEGVDLIATGSHGYGFWKRLTLGSVASKILRLSSRSVLITPMACLAAPPFAEGETSRRGRSVPVSEPLAGIVV
jgi:Universal stress protein UspA and related nucleotide-binding proteins